MKIQPWGGDLIPPPGSMDAATVAVHELFLSYQRAGFTHAEALDLVKAHIAASSQGRNGED